MLVHYTLLPQGYREALRLSEKDKVEKEQAMSVVTLIWVLALFFLVSGLLPMGWALVVGFGSVAAALVWARSIQYRGSELR